MDKKKRPTLLLLFTMMVCLLALGQGRLFGMSGNPVPTVTVVDAETGEPIEGAVAIAIWRKHSILQRAWWEGGTMVVAKIKEAVSDKDGNIYIDGFWGWYIAKNRYPRLTIYKPGYVCWDQLAVYIEELHRERRTDFDKDHRIALIEKWPEGFSFVGHEKFISSVTFSEYTKAQKQLFNKAFEYETLFRVKERSELDKKRRKGQ